MFALTEIKGGWSTIRQLGLQEGRCRHEQTVSRGLSLIVYLPLNTTTSLHWPFWEQSQQSRRIEEGQNSYTQCG